MDTSDIVWFTVMLLALTGLGAFIMWRLCRKEVEITLTVDSELLYEFIDNHAGEAMQNDARVGLYVGGIVKDLTRARELEDRLRTLPLSEAERMVDVIRKDELDRSLAQRATRVWGYHQGTLSTAE